MNTKASIKFSTSTVAPLSYEEAQLFVSGIAAHVTFDLPLTERVAELQDVLAGNADFRAQVERAIIEFKQQDALSDGLAHRICSSLGVDI
jgi:hypothetical protein